MVGRLCALLLLASTAQATETAADCRREAGERVSCSAAGFQTLVTECSIARTDHRVCIRQLDSATEALKKTRADLTTCEAPAPTLPASTPACPAVDHHRQLVGLALGIASAALATVALVAPALPSELRVGMGAGGAVGIITSAVVVAW